MLRNQPLTADSSPTEDVFCELVKEMPRASGLTLGTVRLDYFFFFFAAFFVAK
jgi:hypothetical protein